MGNCSFVTEIIKFPKMWLALYGLIYIAIYAWTIFFIVDLIEVPNLNHFLSQLGCKLISFLKELFIVLAKFNGFLSLAVLCVPSVQSHRGRWSRNFHSIRSREHAVLRLSNLRRLEF